VARGCRLLGNLALVDESDYLAAKLGSPASTEKDQLRGRHLDQLRKGISRQHDIRSLKLRKAILEAESESPDLREALALIRHLSEEQKFTVNFVEKLKATNSL
jgi:hypothetical protein